MSFFRRQFFNIFYYFNPPWDTDISPPELLEHIQQNSPGRALDVGCGTGRNVITLAQHGWEVAGIDFAPRAIRLARRKARRANVSACLTVDDAAKLATVTGPFDLILDMGCLHGLPAEKYPEYRARLVRLLVPGGSYLLYTWLRAAGASGIGLTEADIAAFSPPLTLGRRENDTRHSARPSAWLWFKKDI